MMRPRISSVLLLSISLNFPFTVQAVHEDNNVENVDTPKDFARDTAAEAPVPEEAAVGPVHEAAPANVPVMNLNPLNYLSTDAIIVTGAVLAILSLGFVSKYFLISSNTVISNSNESSPCTKKSEDIFHSKEETIFEGKKFIEHHIYVKDTLGVNILINIESGIFVPVGDEKTSPRKFRLEVQDASKVSSGVKKAAYFAADKDGVVSLSLLVPVNFGNVFSTSAM